MVTASSPSEPEPEALTVQVRVPETPESEGIVRESYAGKLAIILISSFFGILAIPLIPIFLAGGSGADLAKNTTNAVEWLKGAPAHLAGLVGAVVGSYYRSTIERNMTQTG
jgi:hypothetical protein